MNINIFGLLMILIGIFLTISGFRKSNFNVYQLLVAKSRKLWGKNVHIFYQISGLIIIIVGILMAIEII